MFSYKVKTPKSKKRSRDSDLSEDDLTSYAIKKSFNHAGDLISHMSKMEISTPQKLTPSPSTETLYQEVFGNDAAEGNSEYEQSDSDTLFQVKYRPLKLLARPTIQEKFKAIVPKLVNIDGKVVVGSALNSNLNPTWKAKSFLAYGYKFNAKRRAWVKKGPMSVHLQFSPNGNAKVVAHFLYGTNFTAFNFLSNLPPLDL